eukprot:CAMPEP_0180698590 /NCGR_PEP_ID=MMETSP1038_2-20121128/4107_1 /TAXON_ID=632150 /ORGANISM="Azadinium spinosum, Strain 3D9" /LENGTH=108 /DNA_ID=CAMNT_0022730173 /DNA_START=670 /DNA_END=997 /DNA_ORIENTATION=+
MSQTSQAVHILMMATSRSSRELMMIAVSRNSSPNSSAPPKCSALRAPARKEGVSNTVQKAVALMTTVPTLSPTASTKQCHGLVAQRVDAPPGCSTQRAPARKEELTVS